MRIFLILSLVFTVIMAYGQDEDTLQLKEVLVENTSIHKFTTGYQLKVIKVKEDASNLDQLLAENPSIYFKTYGNGQLASIAFRGSSAYHTNVLWHGVPSNYPTLGQMDFSQWPLWMLESIVLQPGNAGALYGSGSIGGTVLLDSELDWQEERPLVQFRMETGSFGHQFLGLKTNFIVGKVGIHTKAFYNRLDNDFRYTYQGEKGIQKNAASTNFGFQQKLSFAHKNQKFLLDAMFGQNDRQIQPTKFNPDEKSTLVTDNIRVAFIHDIQSANHSVNNTISFQQNSTLYQDSIRTTSRQFSMLNNFLKEFNERISVSLGSNINGFVAHSENYVNRVTDEQLSIFASAEFESFVWWKTSINLRQSFYKGNNPFTPSLGNSFRIYNQGNLKIKATQQVSWGFRYPSLNELHWQPGGNPQLLPEKSFGWEAGLKAEFNGDLFTTNLVGTIYHTKSHDWIYWVPNGSAVSPDNLRNVTLKGLEMEWNLNTKNRRINQMYQFSYSLNQAINQTGIYAGRQMIYVPQHNAQFSSTVGFKKWKLNVSGNYTGLRYASLDNSERSIVDEYLILNSALERQLSLGEKEFELGVAANNLANEDYENLKNLAMPGRNYKLNFSLKF
ncbi:MAG: vitamin B12 transporter [Cyclobacteriaceae bacterium]